MRADGGADHLCKHRLTVSSPTKPEQDWLEAVEKLGPDQNVFMKLSGAFNEFNSTTPSSGSELVTSLSPIVSNILEAFGHDIRDDELRILAHPHPISGAMDFHQRLEFLRFHIDRHRDQVLALVAEMK